MAREVRTERKGSNPFMVILIFLVGAGFVGCVLFTINVVNPGFLSRSFPFLFTSPDAALVKENQALSAQNGNLSSALNDSEATNGQLRAELAASRQNQWIPILIVVGVIVVALILFVVWWRNRQNPELTLDEAIAYEEPRARRKYGFPEDYFTQSPVVVARAYERLKGQAGVETNEYMYFIEYQFHRDGPDNQYHHGLHASPHSVVTVALTSKTYRHREQWFPWLKIKQAVQEAHETELWGFALQKTKLEQDILGAVENARSFKEIQQSYAADDAGGDA